MLSGLVAGAIVIAAALATLRMSVYGVLFEDIVSFALGIIVAPVAAATAALVMRATPVRTLATAGLAFLLAFALANLADYGLTVLLFMPNVPGPYQGKPELTEEEVTRIADAWVLGRHVVLCTVGVIGGAALGTLRRPRASH